MPEAKRPSRFRVTPGGPAYLGWRGELLAELAIVRVGELVALKPQPGAGLPFDWVVTSPSGVCFFVKVETYSSARLGIEPESIPVLEMEIEADRLRAASGSPTPVILFLFDGDRDHGRYLRLDTFPPPADGVEAIVLSFPLKNVITGDNIRALAAELARERPVVTSA